jgi:hypothetical protein
LENFATGRLESPPYNFGNTPLPLPPTTMFLLNRIAIPGSADVSSAGWNCLSQRSEPAGRRRSQGVEEIERSAGVPPAAARIAE